MKKKYVYGLFLVCLSISFMFTSCDTTEPKVEAIDYHNKILFTSSRSGKEQLYMMNPDGSDIRQITSGEYWHSNGSWSPDASKIVCNTEENSSTAGTSMVVMNVDGSNRVLLGYGYQMSWSPDKNKIAFIHLPSAELGYRSQFIYTINSDGTNRKRITKDSLEMIYSLSWSIDGSKIYFASNRFDITKFISSELYSMNDDGTEIARLTYTNNGSSYSPSISSLGDKIAFISTMNSALKGSIYVCDIEGNNIALITTPSENKIYNSPRWSPDEQSIIFSSVLSDGTAKTSIYKIGVNGMNLTKLVDSAGSPDWSK